MPGKMTVGVKHVVTQKYIMHINSGSTEQGYALPFANKVDPDQLASEEAN